MEESIHVLRVTAVAPDAGAADPDARRSLVVFVKSPTAELAYAPAEAHVRRLGWRNIDLVNCKIVGPEVVDRLDQALQSAYREAVDRGAAAVVLK
jgi:hypothetical protein